MGAASQGPTAPAPATPTMPDPLLAPIGRHVASRLDWPSRGWEAWLAGRIPRAISCCLNTQRPMQNCATFVRSRQSIQFVRTTPDWRRGMNALVAAATPPAVATGRPPPLPPSLQPSRISAPLVAALFAPAFDSPSTRHSRMRPAATSSVERFSATSSAKSTGADTLCCGKEAAASGVGEAEEEAAEASGDTCRVSGVPSEARMWAV
mmetsp:Transcript_13962/g.42591  ORF Transcript_13962/g.42591 Transcript_13962/m.42591 type:complete len:207 (+) Transcript_13962:1978-2598(+)|eukprot:scaffold197683_cov31-Tisochrysis_lutea.AAC.6